MRGDAAPIGDEGACLRRAASSGQEPADVGICEVKVAEFRHSDGLPLRPFIGGRVAASDPGVCQNLEGLVRRCAWGSWRPVLAYRVAPTSAVGRVIENKVGNRPTGAAAGSESWKRRIMDHAAGLQSPDLFSPNRFTRAAREPRSETSMPVATDTPHTIQGSTGDPVWRKRPQIAAAGINDKSLITCRF